MYDVAVDLRTDFWFCLMWQNSVISVMISTIRMMRAAWNDPEIGISWPKLTGEYRGSASGEGYMVDGVALNLSEKDEKWLGIRDTFKF